MNRGYEAKRVMNGTYGELWLDSDEICEANSFEAKISFDKQDIVQCGQFLTGTKMVGGKGSGTMKLHKVTSHLATLAAQGIKSGSFPSFTLISNLDDPDAYGAERVKLTGVTFDEVTLAAWEAQKPGEQSYPFTFTGYDFIDKVEKR